MSNPASPLSRRRAAIAGVAVLAALAAVVAGALALGSGDSGHARAVATSARTTATPARTTASRTVPGTHASNAGAARHPAREPAAARHPARRSAAGRPVVRQTASASRAAGHTRRRTPVRHSAARGALVAYIGRPTALHAAPGGPVLATLRARTSFGSPETVLVAARRGRWLGVIATEAGNHRLGWVRATAVSETRVHWRLRASLARDRLTVSDGGRVVAQLAVGVGAPGSPTPTGRYAITDRLRTTDPAGPYGCCILALSARAPHHISDWDGGDRIAIHSTTATDTIGRAASHGCIHVTLAEGRWLLARIPLGTPVDVVAG